MTQDVKPILSARVRIAMGGRPYKQVAYSSGMSISYLDRIAHGRSDPTGSKLAALAGALGVSTDWLLGLSEDGGPRC